MNKLSIYTLKVLRKLYEKGLGKPSLTPVTQERNPRKTSDMIYDLLASDKPCMIARFGATELICIHNYLAIRQRDRNVFRYITGKTFDWWWNHNIMKQMQDWSGFFPPTEEKLARFCQLMLEDARMMDLCGVFPSVDVMVKEVLPYMENPQFAALYTLDSFVVEQNPWSRILKGQKVLVIHPFAELIEKQYEKRHLLFNNPDVLPDCELKTIKAVQSLGGDNNGFKDWFEALDWMKREMDATDYDIVLIGCGAYGFPLAAHAKRMGKKAVHIGGALQLLFGIKGSRWEKPHAATQWGLPADFYQKLFDNPAWVRPDEYKTSHSKKVENACYW